MNEIKETAMNHIAGEDKFQVTSSEKKWINHIWKLKEQYPDDVDIKFVNNDGSLVVDVPAPWIKIRPKKKVNLSQEQIAASKERLEAGRQKRINNK